MIKEKNENKFPFANLVWASFVGGCTAGGRFLPTYEAPFWGLFLLGSIIQCLISLIPISIAYKKDSKHKKWIYALSSIFPILMFIIIATIWAIVDKPHKIEAKKASFNK